MSGGQSAEGDAGEDWTCLKPDCDLSAEQHTLAMVLEHTLYDEPNFTAEDAQDVAERTLSKVARAFGLDDEATGELLPADLWDEARDA